ncbi:37S ribosomal protein S8, mitochondrial [Komagataella phaffii CBS 7435]|uniref:Small ribosomal subunit protein bS18m n=2 Tax=Komagataella phaffii TaxID=460519 RepID=C4QWP9_KOMPG|nr:Mitochondrial ribosomal protein of the small subunit [Komagataella phaffii GS115]AOA60455.1 GQ67_02880T0 [Komagataella phaffii]KAI0464942.1 hypothetical protein LJB42_000158 [Komagataella kurtzmanii]CAH2446426.1 37S ribosomal protein S8, mitochondrial [Komagataella phaffii CBS 7435]AOA65533.1 GQ68_02367T0 [Komagataella phaffii GS115]CAY67672.1 Mitochondrial ribosomal protein of the small subunit [Komagataella phaffii GS115]
MLRTVRAYSTNKWVKESTKMRAQVKLAQEVETKKVNIHPRLVREFQERQTYDPIDFSTISAQQATKHRFENAAIENRSHFLDKRVNPLDYYCRPEILSRYLTTGGRILHKDVTGLSNKQQRLLSKAIKRARAAGLLSHVSRDVSFNLKIKN